MGGSADNPSIHAGDIIVAASLSDALQTLRREPDLEIRAGGTYFFDRERLRLPVDREAPILAIHAVRELRRIIKREIDVEIGATVPCGRLRELGERVLPEIVLEALDDIGPPPVRNLATIGGALCLPTQQLPIGAVLDIIDARIEIRRYGNSRSIPIGQLRDENGALRLGPGEIVSRLRIPRRGWNHYDLHVFGRPYPDGDPSLTVAMVAHTDKAVLNEFRCIFMSDGHTVIRPIEAETDLMGRSLPLTERDRRGIISAVERDPRFGEDLDDLGRWRASNSLRLFLQSLS